ncbi:MAG: HDOD domain-containing protein [Gammaproteobacteria bacterium]|nr:HDOD domain-containing protein [Gammaproteobacteria bacterium]
MLLQQPKPKVPLKLLHALTPINELPQQAMEQLARQASIVPCPAKKMLFRRGGSGQYTYYLLKGEVIIENGSGKQETVRSGTHSAMRPIVSVQPYNASGYSKTDVQLLRLPTQTIATLLDANSPEKIVAAVVQKATVPLEERLSLQIYRDYSDNTLELPSLPELATKVRQTAQDPNNSAADLARIIQSDPAITARLIQTANSPLYRGGSQINDIQTAVVRLGLQTTRELVTSLAMRQLFRSRSSAMATHMKALWQHSTHVAAISAVLASMGTGLRAEHALLAGLIHDIGTLVVLAYADQYPELHNNNELLDSTVVKLRPMVGALVMRRWNFANEFITVALHADDWERDSVQGPDYCDVVAVAQIHSFFGTSKAAQCPALIDLPAFHKLPLSRDDPAKSIEVLHQAKRDIAATQRLLSGS